MLGKSWGAFGLSILLALAGCDSSSSGGPNASGKQDGGTGPGVENHEPGSAPSELQDSVVQIDPDNAGNVMGLVSGITGDRLEGAVVELGGKSVMTGADGVFSLGDLNADPKVPIVVTLNGYSSGRARVDVIKGADNYVKVTLAEAESAMLNDAQAGGVMQLSSGVSLDLPANAIVDKDGNAVEGAVQVQIALLNDRDEIAAAPGNMVAQDPDSVESLGETPLESFGMAEVTLLDMKGQEVNLNGKAEATLNIPMAANHGFNAGDLIPLWHYDETANVWKNEGSGTLQDDNTFKINVNHFSWWNADQKLTKTCVIGRVLDASGKPIAAAQMSGEGRSYLGNSHAVTGEGGDFCMEARVGSAIDVSTTVQIDGRLQALAVRVNTPRTTGGCDQPTSCFMIEDLVAVADQQLCDPAKCPQEPGKEACCTTDLGPCDFIVNGDCGGNADGSWDPAPESAGVEQIPGVPMSLPPESDAGTPPEDAGMSMNTNIDLDPTPPEDSGTASEDAGSDAGTSDDAGSDAGVSDDAGFDAGVIDDKDAGNDSGTANDSGTPGDGGQIADASADGAVPDGGNDADGGGGGPGVDRCNDVTVLADLSPVSGTTVGSSLLNDWYDEGSCNDYLPGYERVYSVDVPAGATLRASTSGFGGATFHTVIALDCGDVVGSCVSAQASASYRNGAQTAGTVFVMVDAKEVDKQAPFILYLSTAAPSCGDHFVDIEEACDDGNTSGMDGCDSGCMIEQGYACSPASGACRQIVCGDGIQEGRDDYNGGYEACDDGNANPADGCSDTCNVEPGWVCEQPNTACRQIVCGDGIVDGPMQGGNQKQSLINGGEVISMGGEQCDDGNPNADDGCSDTCQVETGFVCTGAPSVCALRPQGDLCSDPLPLASGNYDLASFNRDYFMGQGPDMTFSGNLPHGQLLRVKGTATFSGYAVLSREMYCPSSLGLEQRFFAGVPFDFVFERQYMEEIQGDGVIVWFSADQPAPSLPLMITSVTLTTPVCGDGAISAQLNETCDDGNLVANDGCDGQCHTEPGYACPQGAGCHLIACNDGNTDWPAEDCEDGNAVSNDGCSSTCRTEAGYLCDWSRMLCELRSAGDLCNNADPIPSGFYQNQFSMAGMTSDYLDCSGCDSTRWFSFVQQPGEVSVIMIDSDFSGHVDLFGTACPLNGNDTSHVFFGNGLYSGEDANLQLWNNDPQARTVWMRVAGYDAAGTFTLRMKTGALGCGDGILNRYGDNYGSPMPQPKESCDDMNGVANDGCSAACQIEPGFRCPYYGGPCAPIVCGDGVVDTQASPSFEQCDDGNANDGDGCNRSCQTEAGAICSSQPSVCTQTIPGDLCENALPLPIGDSQHFIDAFTSDPSDPYSTSYHYGQSAWFALSLQPREVLSLGSSASFDGWLELVGAANGASSCQSPFTMVSNSFGQPLNAVNNGPQPLTVYAVVHTNSYGSVSGSFTLTATVMVPNMDCSSGTCVPIVCGDGQLRGSEQCDDGNQIPGDGCSASCVAETATHICNGSPSVCVPSIAGDSCENAPALVDGQYDFSGFMPEPYCNAVCGGASRWFTVQVPPWRSLRYHASTSETQAQVRMFDISASCWSAEYYNAGGMYDMFYPGQDAQRTWLNLSNATRTIALVVWDQSSISDATFALDHSVQPIGCGDGNLDYGGQYGAYEACDDGNLATGDGCDASCQPEAGWDCGAAGGTCVRVVCGDGMINGTETCDDSNTLGGDGCSPSCAVEPGWLCGGEPYACYRVQNGDMCSNAQPLVDGNYDLSGFLPDLPCHDVCQGPDRWMTISIPPSQTLSVAVSSPESSGLMRWYDITDNGCMNLSGNGGGDTFGSNKTAHSVFVNWSAAQPRTIAIAVTDQYNNPSSLAYGISHTLEPIGCGDGFVDSSGNYSAPEQCDDGNNTNNDGCSSTCTIDQGWVCGNNSPSQCVLPPPGDVCQSAQPLMSGNYNMSGFGDECVIFCAPDRWLTTTLASGDLLVVNATTNSMYATARLYDLTNATCGTAQLITNNYFSYSGSSQLVTQAVGGPATIAYELADLASEPSNASFTLDVHQGMPHCGDSYADIAGAYGVAEQCDDGNNFDNDGCSSTCSYE